jgi:hypothetical protein
MKTKKKKHSRLSYTFLPWEKKVTDCTREEKKKKERKKKKLIEGVFVIKAFNKYPSMFSILFTI